jgi:hypothetical protein
MKITLITPALVAILGLALAGAPITTVQAADSTAPSAPADAAKKSPYHGPITAIDASTVTIDGKTITVDSSTIIKKDKKPAALSDFKVGDIVGGQYTTDSSGKMVATSLSNKGAKKTPAAQ